MTHVGTGSLEVCEYVSITDLVVSSAVVSGAVGTGDKPVVLWPWNTIDDPGCTVGHTCNDTGLQLVVGRSGIANSESSSRCRSERNVWNSGLRGARLTGLEM